MSYLLAGRSSELERLQLQARVAEAELARPGTWGTTFTSIQAYGRLPGVGR